jgi:hypothetical protein
LTSGYPMDLETKYRAFAATWVALAERAASSAEKLRLLDMAGTWLALADHRHHRRHSALNLPEAPEVTAAFHAEAEGGDY